MNNIVLGAKLLQRNIKNIYFYIIIIATILATTLFTAFNYTNKFINTSIDNKTASMLGGDYLIRSLVPIDANIIQKINDLGGVSSRVISFFTMANANDKFNLVAIKSVTTGYPLKGEFKFVDNTSSKNIPRYNQVYVTPDLLAKFNLKVNDDIDIAGQKFKIRNILEAMPSTSSRIFSSVPQVVMHATDAKNLNVLQPGSRASYKLIFNLDSTLLEQLKEVLTPYQELLSANDINVITKETINKVKNYLSLAILVNILLAGLAIMLAAKQYAKSEYKNLAVLKCIGCTGGRYIILISISILILSVLSGFFGSILGNILFLIIKKYILASIQIGSHVALNFDFWHGVSMAVLLNITFVIPDIIKIKQVSPVLVFQQQCPQVTSTSLLFGTMGWSLVLLAAYYVVGNIQILSLFIVSVFILYFVLYTLFGYFFYFFNKLNFNSIIFRISIRNISRKQDLANLQIIVFSLLIGLGVSLYLIQTTFLQSWLQQLPEKTPNYFVLNLLKDEVTIFEKELTAIGIKTEKFYPSIRGRLTKINDKQVQYHRPLNLTFAYELPKDNKLVSGTWFDASANTGELSIDDTFAKRIGAKLGDELTFNADGKDITARITSMREINWNNFRPNFYVIYQPKIAEGLAATYISSFYVEYSKLKDLNAILDKTPGANLLDIDEIIDNMQDVLDMMIKIISYVWNFTLIVGIILLYAITKSLLPDRIADIEVMRKIGIQLRQVKKLYFIEYAILGTVATVAGVLFSVITTSIVAKKVFETSLILNISNIIVILLVSMFSLTFIPYLFSRSGK